MGLYPTRNINLTVNMRLISSKRGCHSTKGSRHNTLSINHTITLVILKINTLTTSSSQARMPYRVHKQWWIIFNKQIRQIMA